VVERRPPHRVRLGLVALALALTVGALGTSPARTASRLARITFYFGLARPESSARAAFFAVGSPGSTTYRRFLTLSQVASHYGATPATKAAFVRVSRRLGLSARIDPSGVFARVSGTVGRFEQVFHVRIRREFNNDVLANAYFPAGNQSLRLPKDMRPLVREVVASYSRSTRPPARAAVTGRVAGASAHPPGNAGTWSGGCAAAEETGAYSFDQVRNAYGLEALGPGTGASVAIINAGEGLTDGDIADAANCFGLPALHTRTLLTDGQARPFGRGSFEPQEDLALVRGMAPGLSAVTFAQVWLAPELWFLGAAKVLDAPSLPDEFSISYGECERDIRGKSASLNTREGAALLDALLVRLGLVGVGAFASAGDFGSTCDGQRFAGVTWPASSPYLTAVGGTRLVLDPANARVDEVVWNDLEWLSANAGGGAGGGGLSAVSQRPPFQRALAVPGTRRAVPDASAHASIFPGWPVVLARNWVVDGGTSASSPLLAGAFATLSANERAAGRPPLGPVNGLLYSLQAGTPDTFFDVVSGANGYDPRVPARRAAPGYDLASGLGVPRFDRLAAAVPSPAGYSPSTQSVARRGGDA
jgi:kumamolisin